MIFVLGRGHWVHDAQAFRKGLARSRIYTTILTISKRAYQFRSASTIPLDTTIGGKSEN